MIVDPFCGLVVRLTKQGGAIEPLPLIQRVSAAIPDSELAMRSVEGSSRQAERDLMERSTKTSDVCQWGWRRWSRSLHLRPTFLSAMPPPAPVSPDALSFGAGLACAFSIPVLAAAFSSAVAATTNDTMNDCILSVVFETHSWSEDNERGIATGWLPGKLSAKGRDLARELGRRRRNDGIAVVFTSDLTRAVETASLAFEGATLPIVQDARLRECNYGELNGGPVTLHHGRRAAHIDRPYPNGQSYRQVEHEVRSFLLEASRKHRGETILVIGHAATRWALDSLVNGRRLEDLVDAPFDWKPGWLYTLTAADVRRLEAAAQPHVQP